MTDVFISVLNMSITAGYVILALLVVRFLLKGMPKKYSYLLWSVVGFRLVCPVSFKSIVSIFNINPFIAKDIVTDSGAMNYMSTEVLSPNVGMGVPYDVVANTDGVTATYGASPILDSFIDFIPYIWLT